MADVVIKSDESFENALRRFKKKCLVTGLVAEMRKREHYESPTLRRKKKEAQSARKLKKRLSLES